MLQQIRTLFRVFATAVAGIGVVAYVLALGDAPDDAPSTSLVATGVGLWGLWSLIATAKLAPPLDCSSDGTLLGTYRARFFLRIAFSDSAALVGFVGSILTGAAWVFLIGAAFTVLGFLRLAPTDRNIAADQDDLDSRGCTRPLRDLLEQAHTGGQNGTS